MIMMGISIHGEISKIIPNYEVKQQEKNQTVEASGALFSCHYMVYSNFFQVKNR